MSCNRYVQFCYYKLVKMQKGLILGLSFLLIVDITYSQTLPRVEAELKLIQKPDPATSKCITVSLSIVNHSSDSLYVPSLWFMSTTEIYLLQKQPSGEYDSVPILGKDNWEKWDTSGGHLEIVHRWGYKDNVISKSFYKQIGAYRDQQDEILSEYYTQMKDSRLKVFLENPFHKPILLKPHQSLQNLNVISLDHYLNEPGEYKIVFQCPKAYDETGFPEKILGYSRFPVEEITSNTLYYQVFY